MPIYEYGCVRCASVFEALRPMSASDADQPCPTCGAASPRRQSSFRPTTGSKTCSAAQARDGTRAVAREARKAAMGTPPFELGAPPPVPRKYLHQITHHGHC